MVNGIANFNRLLKRKAEKNRKNNSFGIANFNRLLKHLSEVNSFSCCFGIANFNRLLKLAVEEIPPNKVSV